MGFPTLKKLAEHFKSDDRIVFLAVQTVFEGFYTNTKSKLRENQLKYDLSIPMAHAEGDPKTHRIPEIMKKYRSGGTPWAVIIDSQGMVVFNGFHIDPDMAVEMIEKLLLQ